MYTIESLDGKRLDEAADEMAQQLKYVYGEFSSWKPDTEPATPENAAKLRGFLNNVEKVKDNVRFLLASSNIRLNSLESGLKTKLMKVQPV